MQSGSVRGWTNGWEPSGYEALELIGFGAVGEVWRARARSSGEVVALRRLPEAEREELQELRRQAAVVRTLPGVHLVRLRSVHGDVLVLDHAPGGSLAALLARRGRLDPGEVVTVVAPVAQALGAAHAAGLVHGHVGLRSVLLTADGMPLLDELGAGHLRERALGLDPTGVLGSAADVWALGALCHVLLAGTAPVPGASLALSAPTVPVPLVRAVDAALVFDAAARPEAAELSALLLQACPARPVTFPAGAIPSAPAVTLRRRRSHAARPGLFGAVSRSALYRGASRSRVLTAGAAAAVLAVVALVGWAWGSGTARSAATTLRAAVAADSGAALDSGAAADSGAALDSGAAAGTGSPGAAKTGSPGAAKTGSPGAATGAGPQPGAPGAPRPRARTPGTPSWAPVLAGLDLARERAYATADASALADVYFPGCAALRTDRGQLMELAARRRTAQGVRHRILSVQPVQVTATTARLRVVESLQAGVLLDEQGAVVLRQAPTAPRAELMRLRRTPVGWRVEQIGLPV